MEIRNLMKVDPGEPRISHQRSKGLPLKFLAALPEETGVLWFGVNDELRRVREELRIARSQSPAPQSLKQCPAEAESLYIRELTLIRLGKRQAGVVHWNKEHLASGIVQKLGMAFGLKKDRPIIAAAYDGVEIDIILCEPTFVPIGVHGSQFLKQLKEEPGGACLPMMAMADVGDSHRLRVFSVTADYAD
jgi:hypothetical protein